MKTKMYLKTNVETFKVSITGLLLFVLVRKDNGCWAQTSIADVVILNDLLNWEHINRTCLARDCDEQVNLKQLQQINTYMNDEADPCEDFHKYACEHWKKEHPNEMTMAAVAYKQITKKLLEIFEDNKSEFKAELRNNAIYHKLNDYYKVCKENEQQNSSILWLYLNELNEMGFVRHSENPSWLQTYKELQLLMDNPYFWEFNINELNKSRYFLNIDVAQNPKKANISINLYQVLKTITSLSFEELQTKFLTLENEVNEIINGVCPSDCSLPETLTYEELLQKQTSINWPDVLSNFKLHSKDKLKIDGIDTLENLFAYLNRQDSHLLYVYNLFKFLSHFEADKLNFLDNVHSPYKCVHHMRKIFDLPMNYLYEKVFYSKIRTESDQLIKNVFEELKQTFAEIVEENQLKFADRNKKYLMSKLNGVSLNIGNLPANVSDDFYQNYLQDYQVTNNFYLNHLLALKHYYTQQLSLASSLKDSTPWISFQNYDPFVLDSATSTAGYSYVTAAITLPFSYLQVPFYTPQFWPSLLYGDLATTLGHELIHAFDPTFLSFDSDGKLANLDFELISKNWHYKNAINCLLRIPTQFLEERVADVSGSRLALLTFKRKYLFSPSNAKLFFLQYAQFFCGTAENFAAFNEEDTSHDMDSVRLNYTMSNLLEFAETFGCRSDASMNPRTKCQLW
ncbi:neprilysin-4 isoform X1 [Glossina fuscipes]|uniref:Neprilysin-4 isoform X1 n=2 Tax=Glossina fuscipes TaxID=7396 RepID=A0A9C5ZD87_9MUSC|nr:neprilysin-4 isoform X1 [Glossina fuscipes]